ncbi:MAG TPA: proteasome subunit alpha [Microlunatus sp.]|nr:proteasome subunit alpha [Microlunatus sp.]
MSMPFYVAPEQQMKDRADFARKGIARGRSVIVLRYADGIVFVAENRSQALHKVSEIYDRIGFAAVGRYNEFENLRTAGIRYADLRGYSYDRTDVTGRGLANAYAQLLGTIFSSGGEKPYEVEIVVAELGPTAETDQIYRLTYDGSVADEDAYAVMGGSAETITEAVRRGYERGLGLAAAVQLAVRALATDGGPNTAPRELGASALEVAILDRSRALPRKFRRIKGAWLTELLDSGTVPPDPGPEPPPSLPPDEVPETELGQHDG